MFVANIQSVKTVLANLRRRENMFANAVGQGLKLCGLFVQRESQQIVPVDTGNLKAGAFTRSVGTGFGTTVTVGYVAAYAMIVHEDLTKAHGKEYNAKYAHLMKGSDALRRRDKKTGKQKEISALFRDYVAERGFQ